MGWFSNESDPGASIPSSSTEGAVELSEAVVDPLRRPCVAELYGSEIVETFESEGAVLAVRGPSVGVGD